MNLKVTSGSISFDDLSGLRYDLGLLLTTRPAIQDFTPPRPPNSFRVVLELNQAERRLDAILLNALKKQNEDLNLREVSRAKFKELFSSGRILIKGQRATPASALAKGITYVDILGY